MTRFFFRIVKLVQLSAHPLPAPTAGKPSRVKGPKPSDSMMRLAGGDKGKPPSVSKFFRTQDDVRGTFIWIYATYNVLIVMVRDTVYEP